MQIAVSLGTSKLQAARAVEAGTITITSSGQFSRIFSTLSNIPSDAVPTGPQVVTMPTSTVTYPGIYTIDPTFISYSTLTSSETLVAITNGPTTSLGAIIDPRPNIGFTIIDGLPYDTWTSLHPGASVAGIADPATGGPAISTVVLSTPTEVISTPNISTPTATMTATMTAAMTTTTTDTLTFKSPIRTATRDLASLASAMSEEAASLNKAAGSMSESASSLSRAATSGIRSAAGSGTAVAAAPLATPFAGPAAMMFIVAGLAMA